jgi:cytochrome P450
MNEALWGTDAALFNPDRKWLPQELWDGATLSGLNPASHRFCPFTFGPRDCIGKNFAQVALSNCASPICLI